MPGLLRGVARTAVVAGTATAVGGRVHRRQERRWANKDAQQQQPAPENYEAQPAAASADDITDGQIDQLNKLGTLKDKGILTQDEFDQKKQKILGL
jgi:hypothetical protein